MTHGAHPPEPPEHGTVHVHDDHAGHGHGHAELGFPIIPETSGADNVLKFLAAAALVGWFAFAGIMLTAPPHHAAGEHGGAKQQPGQTPAEHAQPKVTEPSKG